MTPPDSATTAPVETPPVLAREELRSITFDIIPKSAPTMTAAAAGKPPSAVISNAKRDDSRHSPLTGVMIYMLIVLAFLAPLPLGSNRAVAWAFWAAVIGLMLAMHLFLVRGRPLEQILKGLWAAVALAMFQPLWGLVQMVPGLGSLLGPLAPLPQGIAPETAALLGVDTISLAPNATALAVMRMTAHVGLFLLVVRLVSRSSRALRLMQGLFFGILLHAIWAMVNLVLLGDVAIWGEKTAYLGTATGSFVNRNSFASYLGMGLVLGTVLLMDRDHNPRLRTPNRRAIFSPDNLARLAIAIALLLILIALLATQSRAGLFSSLVGVMVAGLAMRRAASIHASTLDTQKRQLSRQILFGVAGLGLLVILLQGVGLGVIERSIFSAADSSLRFDIYANALARIAERPLTGYGLDSFPIAYELGRSAEGLNDLVQFDAHSTYLENWVEGGVLFGSAIIFAGLFYLRHLFALRNIAIAATDETEARRPMALIAAALGVASLASLHSLVDFSFEIEANVMVFIIILALGVAPLRQKTRRA